MSDNDKDKNGKIIKEENIIMPLATYETYVQGRDVRLTGPNYIRLNIKWKEYTYNGLNAVQVIFNVSVKYDIYGTWAFRLNVGGAQVAADRVYLGMGSTTSEWSASKDVLTGTQYFNKSAMATVVDCYIDNMDYTDIGSGNIMNGTIHQQFNLSLSNVEIKPDVPEFSIQLPNDNTEGRITYYNHTASDAVYRIYGAETALSSGKNNRLRFYTPRAGNATQGRIIVQRWTSSNGWYVMDDTGWNDLPWSYPYLHLHRTFTANDRLDKNIWWRAKAMSRSETNNEASSDWIYFAINDIPQFTNNNPNFVYDKIVPAVKSNIGITWNAANNSYLTTKYTIRYRASITSTWSYAECTTNSFTLNASNLSAYPRGCTIYFDVTPWDALDQTGYVGSGAIKVNTLPTTGSSSVISDKDTSEFNYRYLNNVSFTLPSISDADGQSTKYYLDYTVNNGSSWVNYSTSAQPGTVTINCSNYQNTRGGSFQLRATPHDGLEFGSAIYSKLIYKNQLPTLASTVVQTDKDGMPYNNYYRDNVMLTLPAKSDVDGHGCYYKIDYILEGSSNWVSFNNLYNSSTITINCNTLQSNRGKYVKFRVTPYDVFEEGTPAYTANLIRNVLPKPPELTIDYGKQYLNSVDDVPHNGHVEKILQVQWKAINNACNNQRIDDSNIVVSFHNRSNSRLEHYVGQKLSDTMGGIPLVDINNNYLNFIGRGSQFDFFVIVEDIFGETSQTLVGPLTRNNTPTIPAGFHMGYSQPIETIPANKKYRRAYFKKSTDVENDSIYYEIQIKRYNSNNWQTLFNSYQSNNSDIVWDITISDPNCNDVFRIRSIDIHGAYSDWIASNEHTLPRVKLFGPQKIYTKTPRILFGLENYTYPNGYVNISIAINGVTYTNISNPEYFSIISYKENAKGIFRVPTDLTINEDQLGNNINIRTFLGDVNGQLLISNLNCYNSLQPVISSGTMINASINNNLQTMIDDYYTSYKCTFTKQPMNVKNVGEISTAVNYNNMYTNLYKINEHINNFDVDFNPNGNLSFNMNNTNKAQGTNHMLNDINYILDVLTTQI